MIAAIPLSMALCGTATSQSTVTNDQTQDGGVVASQELDVVTNSSDTTALTTATGNSFIGSVVTGSVDIQSNQTLNGDVQGTTIVNVANDAGPTTQSITAATGNAGASVIQGGGAITGNFVQTTTNANVGGESQINATDAQTADASFSVQAVANGEQFGATDSTIAASVTQTNTASAIADGGVILGALNDQGSFAAIGAGNNLTSVGQGNSSQNLAVNQVNNGAITQGAIFANFGQSEITDTSALATGNNANITNTQGSLTVAANQDNESFVHAQAVDTSFAYGGATVDAEGVGNSVVAANAGPNVVLNNVQLNGVGGVESSATFQGDNGFDAFVNSSATGNAVTGFACSSCGGVMSVQNSQTNLGDVNSTSSVGLTNSARSVRGVATAVGNTATFYVSSPSGQ
ncbi:MAG TPA: holdfast anchor protein HfaD [Caulobacteraceae bacterium]|jgi:hypothetical protein